MRLELDEVQLTPGSQVFKESCGYEFDSYWSDPEGLEDSICVFRVLKVDDDGERGGVDDKKDTQSGKDVARISMDGNCDDCIEIALIDVREDERGQGIARWIVDAILDKFADTKLIATPEEELAGFWEHLGWRRVEDADELHGFKMLAPRGWD
ncbi:GNAT family N-acetyltransferase [Corynebacterium falsenii]